MKESFYSRVTMRSNRSLTLTEHLSAELGTSKVASIEAKEGHVITFGKLKDGGVLLTSSFNDEANGAVRVVSVELPPPGTTSALLNGSTWSPDGCVVDEGRIITNPVVDRAELEGLFPPLPKLAE
jgi:hypothetical protein